MVQDLSVNRVILPRVTILQMLPMLIISNIRALLNDAHSNSLCVATIFKCLCPICTHPSECDYTWPKAATVRGDQSPPFSQEKHCGHQVRSVSQITAEF